MNTATKAVPKEGALAAGIGLARLGRKQEARLMLRQACCDDPDSAKAWLWSASVAETVPEAVDCLKRALAIEPDNTTARDWYAKLRPTLVKVNVYYCFLCGHEAGREFDQCPQCGTLFSLELEETLSNTRIDDAELRSAIARLQATEGAAESFDTQYFLAVAYLNLCETQSALRHLRLAERLDERGVYLRETIDVLSRRPLILAVDDCNTVRAVISSALEHNGYRCLAVASGIDALSYLEVAGRSVPGDGADVLIRGGDLADAAVAIFGEVHVAGRVHAKRVGGLDGDDAAGGQPAVAVALSIG